MGSSSISFLWLNLRTGAIIKQLHTFFTIFIKYCVKIDTHLDGHDGGIFDSFNCADVIHAIADRFVL